MFRLALLRIALLIGLLSAPVLAEKFSFNIASPVAAQDFRAKGSSFVIRTEGCAETIKPQITATAEGKLNGERQTRTLQVGALQKPGVYAIWQGWPNEGDWVVSIAGTCGDAKAGALVPMGPKGLIRESSKFFSRPATDKEIEKSLKELTQGGKK